MDESVLVAQLKASLQDSATTFTADNDADFKRHIKVAVEDLHRVRPNNRILSLELQANQGTYPVPADFVYPRFTTWGDQLRRHQEPWRINNAWRSWKPPVLRHVVLNGEHKVQLSPAPTANEITMMGPEMEITYNSMWALEEVRDVDARVLMLRAQAEAMLELTNRGIAKPVQLRDGQSQGAKNAGPAAMYEMLMKRFLENAK